MINGLQITPNNCLITKKAVFFDQLSNYKGKSNVVFWPLADAHQLPFLDEGEVDACN